MGRKKSKPEAAAVVEVAKDAAVGAPVADKDIVSLVAADAAPADSRTTVELPTFYVDPKTVVVEDDSRIIPNHDQFAKDRDLAVNLYIYGQKQPVVVYPTGTDDVNTAITGHSRKRAVELLREGFEWIDPRTNETVKFHDPERLLWIAVDTSKSKEEAFIEGVQTNIKVNALSIVQEAYIVKRLMDKYGYSLTDAARMFGYNNTNRQSRLLDVLDMEQEIIEKLHAGQMSLDTAYSLKGLKSEARLKVVAENTDEIGNVAGNKVKETLRNLFSAGDGQVSLSINDAGEVVATKKEAADKGEKTSGKKGKDEEEKGEKPLKLDRNVADFKKFVARETESADAKLSDPACLLLERFVEWFAGKKGDTSLRNALIEYTKAK